MDYVIQNNFLRVTVSSLGAELTSVQSQQSGYEYLWQADKKIWGRHAPILFPIVGRLKGDEYTYQGQTYHMGQHGFARDSEFTVQRQVSDSITLVLTDNEQTRAVYPFKFELRVNYNLLNNLLEENFTVINKSNGQMIFGIGGHPGFNLPVSDTIKKEDFYFSTKPSKARINVPLKGAYLDWENRFLAPTNSLISLSDRLFSRDALIFQLRGHANKISLSTDTSDFHINVWTRDAPFLGIWSQYPNTGNFVCIEPWWGIADKLTADGQLENKFGMNTLGPAEEFHAGFGIAFHE